jgi:cell division protein FtsW (lipid II flippase)
MSGYLALLAATAWLTLLLSRARFNLLVRLAVVGGLWAGAAQLGGLVVAESSAPRLWQMLLAPAGLVLLDGLYRRWRHLPAFLPPRATASWPWLLPGWVLLTGYGLIWLTDYSARAHPKNAFLVVDQASYLWQAYVALTLSATLAPWLLQRVMALLQWVQMRRLGDVFALLFVLPTLGLLLLKTLIANSTLPLTDATKLLAKLPLIDAEQAGKLANSLMHGWPQWWLLAVGLLILLITSGAWGARQQRLNAGFWLKQEGSGSLVLLLLLPLAALTMLTSGARDSGAGEMTRWVFWWLLAWQLYRWVERPDMLRLEIRAKQYLFQLFWLLVTLFVLFFTMFGVVKDSGQTLAFLLSTAVPGVLVGGILASRILALEPRTRQWMNTRLGWLLCQVTVLTVLVGIVFVLYWLAAWMGGDKPRVAERLEALINPFGASQEFLAELRWGAQAGGWGGFGVGHVPWCGWQGSIGGGCGGMPNQTQSDYVFNGLGAVYGYGYAFLLVAAMLYWMFRIARLPAFVAGRTHAAQVFRSWLLLLVALSMATQTLVTIAGSLGMALLTGITLPLFSYGVAGLVLLAMLLGLGMNVWEE